MEDHGNFGQPEDSYHRAFVRERHAGGNVRTDTFHRSHARWRCGWSRTLVLSSSHRLHRNLCAGGHGRALRCLPPRSYDLRLYGA